MHEHTERSTMKLDSKPTRITEWILNPRTPQRLAVAAVILLSVVPVVFFIRNMIFFPCHARDYYPYFHQMAVGLSALALFSFFYQCYMQKRNVVTLLRETPPMLWFLGMTVLMLLSCLVNGVNNYARYGFNVNETIYLSFAFFLLYFPAGMLVRRPSDKRLILRLFVITGMFTAVTELIHIYITPLDVYSAYGYYAVPPMLMFPNTNFYGYLLSMFLPACAGLVIAEESLFWRVFSFAAFLANAAVLFLNGTFGAVLAVPCALIFQVIVIFLTKKRLSVMTLVLLGSYLLLYVLTERLIPVTRCHVIHCRLDDMIPFREGFVVFYVGWYLFVAGAVAYTLFYDVESFKHLQTYIIVTQIAAMLCYIFYPSIQTLRPAEFPRQNVFTWVLGIIYAFDTPTGVCPSLHVAYTLGICSVWLKKKDASTLWKVILCLWGALICVSTAFVKQHSVLDVLAALPVALAAEIIVYGRDYWLVRLKRKDKGYQHE